MNDFIVHTDQSLVTDKNHTIVFSTRIGSILEKDQNIHAQTIANILNGHEPELPVEIDRHWMFDETPGINGFFGIIVPGGYPISSSKPTDNQWFLFARFNDQSTARKICNIVNQSLGWKFNGIEQQNIINNKFLAVRDRGTTFEASIDYRVLGCYDSLKQARKTAEHAALELSPIPDKSRIERLQEELTESYPRAIGF